MAVRRLLTLLHAWLGALAAVFVILVAGSGAALAFMSEMFEAQYGPVLEATTPRPGAAYADIDRLLQGARDGYGRPFTPLGVLMPGSRVEGIETAMPFGIPEGGSGFEDTWMFSVDPWTGAYKGAFRLDDAFAHQLIHFHHQLFAGEIGAAFVAALGLLLAAFALTGLWLWWPRNGGAWRKAVNLDLGGGARRALFSLHGWAGVWASVAILLFSVTGVGTAKPDWFGPLLAGAPESPPPAAGFDRRCEGAVTPGQAALAAERAFPGRRLAMLYFGGGPDAPYRLSLKGGRDLDRMGGDLIVYAHPTCAGLTYAVDVSRGSLTEKAGQIMFSLHGGYSFGPWLGDILVIVTGLALVVLSASGVYVFFTRTLRLGGRRPARAVDPRPEPAFAPAE